MNCWSQIHAMLGVFISSNGGSCGGEKCRFPYSLRARTSKMLIWVSEFADTVPGLRWWFLSYENIKWIWFLWKSFRLCSQFDLRKPYGILFPVSLFLHTWSKNLPPLSPKSTFSKHWKQLWLGLTSWQCQRCLHTLHVEKIIRALHAINTNCRSTQTLGQTMIYTAVILLSSWIIPGPKVFILSFLTFSPHHYNFHASFM